MTAATRLRPARAEDFELAKRLLASSGLPVDDLTPGHLAFAVTESGRVIGVIGVETLDDTGLLRSLAVAPEARGRAVGEALVEALERDCRGRGIGSLWLLTTDADQYFSRLGYSARDRSQAPAVVRGTAQFSTLCPASAVLMFKALA